MTVLSVSSFADEINSLSSVTESERYINSMHDSFKDTD